ncbi:MAG: prepilin peptidase [Alkalinema sp. RU_4_3]|nr:prepilin peptidase [Alkalinema sp. RU_4_3]
MDLTLWPVALVVFCLGSAIGSFLNVVIYRLPAGLSVVHPPSRCPVCFTPLRKQDNVPILGWLKLRGKCAHCGTPISARYPMVELTTGMLYLVCLLVFGLSLQTVGYWLFLSLLLSLALIDFDTMTLSDPLMKLGVVGGLMFQFAIGVSMGGIPGGIIGLVTGVIGMVVGILLLDGISIVGSMLLRRQAMGAGDAMLAAMMGAWLGWRSFLVALFLSALSGALVGLLGRISSKLGRYQQMPFGPFLAIGSLLTLFFGGPMLSAYLGLFPG